MGIGSYDDLDKKLVEKYSDVQTVNPEICEKLSEDTCCCSCKDNSKSLTLFYGLNADNKVREEFDKFNNRWQELQARKRKKLKSGVKKEIHDRLFEETDALRKELQDYVNPNRMYERLGVDVLSITFSEVLLPIVDPDEKGTLLREICVLRHSLTDEYGYIIPNLRVMDSEKLSGNCFEIYVRGRKVFVGELSNSDVENANPMPIIENLKNVCFEYVHQILSKTDVLKLMELIRSQDPTLVNDLIPVFLSPIDLKNILANLLQSKISIKDIVMIFEVLNDYARYTQSSDKLTEILKKELIFGIE